MMHADRLSQLKNIKGNDSVGCFGLVAVGSDLNFAVFYTATDG